MTALPIHIDGLIYSKQAHGGISRNFTNLINAFSHRSDAEVNLYLEQSMPLPDGMSPIRIRKIPGDKHMRPSRVLHKLSAALARRRRRSLWSSVSSGIFHSSFYSSPEGLLIPQVLTMHDTIFEDFPQMFGAEKHLRHIADKRRALSNSNAVVFPSAYARDRARAIYSLGQRPAVVIPHAVDIRFHEVPAQAEVASWHREVTGSRPFLLHVGARYRHKNVARLLEAYAAWNQRGDIALVLAGGGPLDEDERQLIVTPGLDRDVLVLPRMSDEQLRAAYHAATAFVFPSLSEGFGFPLLEALACGCPSACSNAGSLREVGGSAPIYFDPANINSLRHALTEVVKSANNRDRWESARALALQRTWHHVANEYLDFYKLVISRSR